MGSSARFRRRLKGRPETFVLLKLVPGVVGNQGYTGLPLDFSERRNAAASRRSIQGSLEDLHFSRHLDF
jgi:hypothetical protein